MTKTFLERILPGRITCDFLRSFGNVVSVDGKALVVYGQGWSQWVTTDGISFDFHTTNPSGGHSLTVSVTDANRLLAHWNGFVANQKNPQAWS